jgi:hypothetical protein
LFCVGTKSEFGSSPSVFGLDMWTHLGIDFWFWVHSISGFSFAS